MGADEAASAWNIAGHGGSDHDRRESVIRVLVLKSPAWEEPTSLLPTCIVLAKAGHGVSPEFSGEGRVVSP